MLSWIYNKNDGDWDWWREDPRPEFPDQHVAHVYKHKDRYSLSVWDGCGGGEDFTLDELEAFANELLRFVKDQREEER